MFVKRAICSKPKYTRSIPSAHGLQPRCPVSATPTHMLRICVNPRPALIAGVQAMRARICSAISCDMFARVVWLRLWRAQNHRLSPCPFATRTRHARLARLTRARRQWFGRRTARVLLADFWYFSSLKSTIKEKYLYVFFVSISPRVHKKTTIMPTVKKGALTAPFSAYLLNL